MNAILQSSYSVITYTHFPHQITALKFDEDNGLTLGVGTSNGQCMLYDIRSSKPLYIKDHQYGLPIVDITFHNSTRHIISSDKKIIKIWSRDETTSSHDPATNSGYDGSSLINSNDEEFVSKNMGKILTNIETTADINSILRVRENRGLTGLVLVAGEQPRVMTYFVPALGPAPRWCSYLEGITEELEESSNTEIYEDYKFLTLSEIEELGASSLIGTSLLKAYMHGYFIDVKLYMKLRSVSKPFEYEEFRKKKIQDKIDEKRKSRISALKRLPKVNQALAERFLKKNSTKHSNANGDVSVAPSDSAGGHDSRGGDAGEKTVVDAPLIDDRFSALFLRDEFEVDPNSYDYKLRNPSSGMNQTKRSGSVDAGGRRKRGYGDGSDDELDEYMYDEVHVGGGDDAEEEGEDGDEYEDENDDLVSVRYDGSYDNDPAGHTLEKSRPTKLKQESKKGRQSVKRSNSDNGKLRMFEALQSSSAPLVSTLYREATQKSGNNSSKSGLLRSESNKPLIDRVSGSTYHSQSGTERSKNSIRTVQREEGGDTRRAAGRESGGIMREMSYVPRAEKVTGRKSGRPSDGGTMGYGDDRRLGLGDDNLFASDKQKRGSGRGGGGVGGGGASGRGGGRSGMDRSKTLSKKRRR